MEIKVEDVYKLEHDFIKKAFQLASEGQVLGTLDTIRGAHVMACAVIMAIEKKQSEE